MSFAINIYMKEIERYPILSPEVQTQLAVKAKAGDQKAKEDLVKSNLRFVFSIAKQYQNQGIPLEDLISEGNMGVLAAIENFNPDRARFLTYAGWWIRQRIMMALSEQTRQVRLPANRISILEQAKKAENRLQQELQRDVSSAEVNTEIDVLSTDVVHHSSFSYSADHDDNRSAMDTIENTETPSPIDGLIQESQHQELMMVLNKLGIREREIIKLYYGIGCDHAHTLEELGDKMNLTRERIRQLRNKALRELRRLNRRKKMDALKD